MSRSSALKRKQPDSSSPSESLTEHEKLIYNVIQSKQDMGIWEQHLKQEINLLVAKSVKSLKAKQLIKEVPNVQSKGRKHLMAAEFEPSKELTGGDWYADGGLDQEYLNFAKDRLAKSIYQEKVATFEGISDTIRKSGVFKTKFTKQQTEDLLRALVLENRIMEVRSTGIGDFASIPVGEVCYKCTRRGGTRGEPEVDGCRSLLLFQQLIKEVPNVQSKGRKHLMAAEFQPSKELTGGDWYADGDLHQEYLNFAKDWFAKTIYKEKVATSEGISDTIRKSGVFKSKSTKQQTEDLLRALVLENRIMEVRSTGIGDFSSIPVGEVCYKCTRREGTRVELEVGAMAMQKYNKLFASFS